MILTGEAPRGNSFLRIFSFLNISKINLLNTSTIIRLVTISVNVPYVLVLLRNSFNQGCKSGSGFKHWIWIQKQENEKNILVCTGKYFNFDNLKEQNNTIC
jgi:hypothetical protein